jgi:hypothetical protein
MELELQYSAAKKLLGETMVSLPRRSPIPGLEKGSFLDPCTLSAYMRCGQTKPR